MIPLFAQIFCIIVDLLADPRRPVVARPYRSIAPGLYQQEKHKSPIFHIAQLINSFTATYFPGGLSLRYMLGS